MSGDYFLSITRFQHIFLASNPATVQFIYRRDGLTEPDETFALQLQSDSAIPLPTGPGVFYRQTLQCTIVDGDGEELC